MSLLRNYNPDDKFKISLIENSNTLPPIEQENVETDASIKGKFISMNFCIYSLFLGNYIREANQKRTETFRINKAAAVSNAKA